MSATSTDQTAAATHTDVLLVDDSLVDLQLLVEMMTLHKLRISIAMDGVRGLEQAGLLQPSLILLDVHMPKLNGFKVCQQLKSNPLTRLIPVIFLTHSNDLNERLEGFSVGGVDYIGKPFEVMEVLARVGVHLQRRIQPDHKTDDGDLMVSAVQHLLRSCMANPPGLDELARRFATNRRRLNEVFQARCGQPVFGWLREERLRLAYMQVCQTNQQFSGISDSLGYSTSANFTKAFRQRFGFTPSELRCRITGASETDAS